MKNALLVVTLVFVASLWLGWEAPPSVAENLLDALRQFVGPLRGQGLVVVFLAIFINNALKALLAILLGIGFGVVPLLFVALNGYTIGAVVKAVALERGVSAAILALVPHGVIEVPAVLVASAFGVAIGWEAVLRVFRRSGRVGSLLRQGLRVYLRWIAPALAVAAMVEVVLTPLIVRSIAG